MKNQTNQNDMMVFNEAVVKVIILRGIDFTKPRHFSFQLTTLENDRWVLVPANTTRISEAKPGAEVLLQTGTTNSFENGVEVIKNTYITVAKKIEKDKWEINARLVIEHLI